MAAVGLCQKKSEQAEIFTAFDNLFNTLKTRETDKGVAFYQWGEPKSLPVKISDKEVPEYDGGDVKESKSLCEVRGSSLSVPYWGRLKQGNRQKKNPGKTQGL